MCMACGCGIKDKKDPGYGKGPKKGSKTSDKKMPPKAKKK